MEIDPAHMASPVFCDEQPGGNIGVMVQASDHDFVAGLQSSSQAAADSEGEGSHVGTKDDLLGAGGIEKVGYRPACFSHDGVGFSTGTKRAAVVGIGVLQVV